MSVAIFSPGKTQKKLVCVTLLHSVVPVRILGWWLLCSSIAAVLKFRERNMYAWSITRPSWTMIFQIHTCTQGQCNPHSRRGSTGIPRLPQFHMSMRGFSNPSISIIHKYNAVIFRHLVDVIVSQLALWHSSLSRSNVALGNALVRISAKLISVVFLWRITNCSTNTYYISAIVCATNLNLISKCLLRPK
jgi:hypothetical protein